MNFGARKDGFLEINTTNTLAHLRAPPASGYDCPPLHLAAKRGQVEVIALLLDLGGNAQIPNKAGQTPLHYAAEHGHLAALILLIEHGAILEAQDNKGQTALHLAAANGHLPIAEHLVVVCQADVNTSRKDHYTPLHLAASRNHLEVVRLLIRHDADLTRTHCYVGSPLHISAKYNLPEITALLLSQGANPYSQNKNGVLPISLAKNPVVIQSLQRSMDKKVAKTFIMSLRRYREAQDEDVKKHWPIKGLPTEIVEDLILPYLGIHRKV